MKYIFSYGTDVFYICVLDRFCTCILNARVKAKWMRILMLAVFMVFYDIISYFWFRIKLLMVCFGILWHLVIFSILYCGNFKTNIIVVLFITISNMLSEVILFLLFSTFKLWNINVNEIPFRYALTGSVVSKIIMFIFIKLFILMFKIIERKKLGKQEYTEDISFYDWVEVVIVPITTVVILMFMVSSTNITSGWIFICLALLAVNIFSYDQYNRLKVNIINVDLFSGLKELCRMSKQYAENVNLKWQELRHFRHDIKKNYMLEMMYLSLGELEKLQKCYQDVMSMDIFQSIKTGNYLIDMLIMQAENKAEKLGIKSVFDIRVPADICFDEYRINRLLGNVIDNSVEAAAKCNETDRWIKLVIRLCNNNMYIECSNACRITDKEKDAIANQQSTKENKILHGCGMKIIRQITDSYHGIVETEYGNNLFKIKILLCNVEQEQNHY